MKPFELGEMINEFGVMITVKEREGSHGFDENGDPVELPAVETEMLAIVVPFSDAELRMFEPGYVTASERKLYTLDPLDLDKTVTYRGEEYTVNAWKDYDDLADVHIYRMSRRDNRGQ